MVIRQLLAIIRYLYQQVVGMNGKNIIERENSIKDDQFSRLIISKSNGNSTKMLWVPNKKS